MNIKIDENLPRQIARTLKSLGHNVHTTLEEGLSGCADPLIWDECQREGRLLITQDLDFSDARRFAPGTHYGILLLRLRSPSRVTLIRRIEELFKDENAESWVGCFIVATERKVRVRRPQNSS
jgi:predicted nuclease of predicted toxin-antitoxin system